MNEYEIRISYSWGDEEEPIEFEAETEFDAFMRMFTIAANELRTSMQDGHEDSYHAIRVYPNENRIVLHYGYDDEQCFYDLV